MLETAPESAALADFARAARPRVKPDTARLALNPDDVQNGLARLVLSVLELLRELLERQAIRRMEAGSLTDDEVERLGMTFLRLSEEVERLAGQFGLTREDLNLDLGPLGRLI